MPEISAADLAASQRALVIAPAGCGKTHLLASAVAHSKGRQLVLTHTHAGVNAMCRRLQELHVPAERYHVCTLDGLALRYAVAFPSVSGWRKSMPTEDDWVALRPSALKALQLQVADTVLRASYAGVFVDEYQDCCRAQHGLVLRLAEVLPCRVLGDPLQAIFAELNKDAALPWSAVEGAFPLLGKLGHPHRRAGKNVELGEWLLSIRDALMAGQEIDLSGVKCLQFVQAKPGAAISQCLGHLGRDDESVIGLREHRRQCHQLAGSLRNNYAVFEDANGTDLLRAAKKIDGASGIARVDLVNTLARRWLKNIPSPALKPILASVASRTPIRARRADLVRLGEMMEKVRDHDSHAHVAGMMEAYAELDRRPTFCSREVWKGLASAAKHAGSEPGMSLHDATWQGRDRYRRAGRNAPHRCLSTPLLVKGLQFDRAIVLNAADFPGSEALYVALTRGARGLTVISDSTRLATKRMAKP